MNRPILILALLILVLLSCVSWGSGVAVRETLGGATVLLGTGPHLRVPLYHRIYRYDTQPVTLDEPLAIVTRDNATFKLPCHLTAHVSVPDALAFHKASSGREAGPFILETARAAILDTAKTMSTDQILTPVAAGQISQQVSSALLGRGISDDGLQIGSPGAQVIFNAVLDDLNRQFPASARKLAEASLAKDPHEALNHAAMGVVLEAEGKPADAEAQYVEALYLDPTAIEPMSRLFLLNQKVGTPDSLAKLERLLQASLVKKTDSAIHHDWLGQVFLRTGRYDKAELAFTTAINLAPQTPEFHLSMGSLRARQGHYDQAREAYLEALKIKPEHTLALYNLGVTYALEGDLDRAIASFEHAAQTAPPSVPLLNALAQAYEQKGETAKAIDALRRSLAARPDQKDRAADLKRLSAKTKTG
ncbi:MAG TPA: tetratricopeptide repeat protein [Dongiaceae bacterium]|nr:tetratricopeptide repeat protein [Dongiaceae bacterium]